MGQAISTEGMMRRLHLVGQVLRGIQV